MSREIKFRFWWILQAKMDYDPKVNEYHSLNNQFNGTSSVTIIMQYIGLKDNTGKEIYEGDLLVRSWDRDSSLIIRVSYSNGSDEGVAGGLVGYNVYGNHDEVVKEYCFDGRVVGNIYENPELLED